jgi:hypothetical protein
VDNGIAMTGEFHGVTKGITMKLLHFLKKNQIHFVLGVGMQWAKCREWTAPLHCLTSLTKNLRRDFLP